MVVGPGNIDMMKSIQREGRTMLLREVRDGRALACYTAPHTPHAGFIGPGRSFLINVKSHAN